jgi:imidazole glycerol-phosphate synthase subunit HisH
VSPKSGGPMVGIIDYGMGNLRSVANAFRFVGAGVECVTDPAGLRHVDAIVLPGVGAFGDGIRNLHERGFVGPLAEEVLHKGKPFLGICLGMQLLATTGLEHGTFAGLGWIPGVVDRFPNATGEGPLRVPHIGWNDVRFVERGGLFDDLGESASFYFVHSYKVEPQDKGVVSGWCEYGVPFAASIRRGNIVATQFHPEKSHRAGLSLLRNFLRLGK